MHARTPFRAPHTLPCTAHHPAQTAAVLSRFVFQITSLTSTAPHPHACAPHPPRSDAPSLFFQSAALPLPQRTGPFCLRACSLPFVCAPPRAMAVCRAPSEWALFVRLRTWRLSLSFFLAFFPTARSLALSSRQPPCLRLIPRIAATHNAHTHTHALYRYLSYSPYCGAPGPL
jgi:hypothetical protein